MRQDRFYLIYYNCYDGDKLAKVKSFDVIMAIKRFAESQGANFYSSKQRDPRTFVAEVNSKVEHFYIYEVFDYNWCLLPRGQKESEIDFIS